MCQIRLVRNRLESVHSYKSEAGIVVSSSATDGERVTVIVNQTHDGLLGFSVRGGVEHGLNIFISKVEPHSPAGRAGLCMGDKLLEVNGVSLENISINSAVRVLTGHRRLRLVLQRVGWVPGVRLGNEKTTWVDLIHQRLVVEEGGMSRSGGCSDATVCRSVPLQTSLSQPCLGLNIRGGIEYGLGIYVSGVDPGGLAEQGGIKTGDQILSANGVSLEHVTHSRAVGVLKSQSHVTLVIKETGRYPAYQEIVDKHSWLDKRSSGTYHSLSRGSDSSCGSSLSSGTPLSSVTGVSQATLPVCLPFGAQLSGVSSFTAGLSCGPTELLHDSAIRAKEGRERRKTDVPMALSRPRAPLFRTQSHMTVSGEEKEQRTENRKQMERREGYKNVLNHWKTFFGLPWTRDSSKSPTGSPTRSPTRSSTGSPTRSSTRSPTGSPTGSSTGSSIRSPTGSPTRSPTGSSTGSPTGSSTGSPTRSPRNSELGTGATTQELSGLEVLAHVEKMAIKLLKTEDVAVVMEICRQYTVEQELKTLVPPLLAMLDRPEKLLLLREIRMLVSKDDVQQFNNMLSSFEDEACDILKRCSYQPGEYRQNHLLEEIEHLCMTQQPDEVQEPSRALSPLLDVTIVGCPHTESLGPTRAAPNIPNWLLTEKTCSKIPPAADRDMLCSDEDSSHRESPTNTKETEKEDTVFTVVDTPHPKRPLLSQIFGTLKRSQSTRVPPTEPSGQHRAQEHVRSGSLFIWTRTVKTEQEAGFELVSADGVSLQHITHQDAMEVIRQVFNSRNTDPMELAVKGPPHF
ncbi:hypothetical protein P4O66_011356 [Electrophorus voltai]|uniref:PDZ domain-containing protein n=1 Tax=Electrophorus voltai TaxID=2609070 RepID=A0AAD8Z7V9_9TELE|nr:hypothetical protein P4O66_011356 [Electrophorus voltai]